MEILNKNRLEKRLNNIRERIPSKIKEEMHEQVHSRNSVAILEEIS